MPSPGVSVVVVPGLADPDFGAAAAVLGRSDFPRDRVIGAPTVWCGGRPELEVNTWLRVRRREVQATTLRDNADHLKRWVRFLRSRGRDVRDATEHDYRAYESGHLDPRRGEDGARQAATTDSAWRNVRSTLGMFHRWLERHHGVTSPVAEHVDERTGRRRYTSRRLVSSAPAVYPLTPDTFDVLVDAAHRTTSGGAERVGAGREEALLEWLVSTGQRISTAVHTTIYELPPPAGAGLFPVQVPDALEVADDLTQTGTASPDPASVPRAGLMQPVRTAAAITKNNRAVLHMGFARRLDTVRDYAVGDRDALTRRPHRPTNALHLLTANALEVTFRHEETGEVESRRSWNTVTADERRRLVDQDGRCVMLFVTQSGRPWSVGSARNAITNAARHAAGQAAGDGVPFPVGVHPHSMRHTYAVWIAMLRAMRDHEAGYAHLDMSRESIVQHTARQLGHAAPGDRQGVTDIYLAFLEEYLLDPTITPERIKGVR